MFKKSPFKHADVVKIYKHISHLFTMQPMHQNALKNAQSLEDCGYLSDATVCVGSDGKVTWVGLTQDETQMPSSNEKTEEINCKGETWLPGLIDSHTHLVFGGQRSIETMRKRTGESYLQIAKEGGGIQSTVQKTRSCSEAELLQLGAERMKTSLNFGVRHIEIKTGYGLSFREEVKLLNVIQGLKRQFSNQLGVTSTFLGAHAIPKEKKPETYVKEVCEEMLPYVAEKKCAEFCDVFIEEGFFTLKQGEEILTRAKNLGLKLKAHVDECTSLGGVELACQLGATSIEHGIKMTDSGIKSLSQSETTLVLLPMTSFVLQEGFAPARKIIDSGVRVAIATDFNPGSSPSQNLILTALMGMIHTGLTPYEVLSAITYNGAKACDLSETLGHISVGGPACFTRLAYEDWQELFYWVGQPLPLIQ